MNALISIFSRFSLFVLIMQFLFISALLLKGGEFLSSPKHEPQKADLIVVLGGGVGDRLKKGYELFASGLSTRILLTGFPELNDGVLPVYAKWRIRYLTELGIPESAILTDNTAKNTVEEARIIKKLMLENQWKNVLIVSDPPHLRRLSIIFSKVFEDRSNLNYALISSNSSWWSASRWWKNTISAQFFILEVIKLFYFYFRNI